MNDDDTEPTPITDSYGDAILALIVPVGFIAFAALGWEMSEWKVGEMAEVMATGDSGPEGRIVQLKDRYKNVYGSWKWTTVETRFDPIDNRPVYESDIRRPDPIREPVIGKIVPEMRQTLDKLDLVAVRPESPSVADVWAGILRWWQADPANRRVEPIGNGHVIHLKATTLNPLTTREFVFAEPVSAESTVLNIEGAMRSLYAGIIRIPGTTYHTGEAD